MGIEPLLYQFYYSIVISDKICDQTNKQIVKIKLKTRSKSQKFPYLILSIQNRRKKIKSSKEAIWRKAFIQSVMQKKCITTTHHGEFFFCTQNQKITEWVEKSSLPTFWCLAGDANLFSDFTRKVYFSSF